MKKALFLFLLMTLYFQLHAHEYNPNTKNMVLVQVLGPIVNIMQQKEPIPIMAEYQHPITKDISISLPTILFIGKDPDITFGAGFYWYFRRNYFPFFLAFYPALDVSIQRIIDTGKYEWDMAVDMGVPYAFNEIFCAELKLGFQIWDVLSGEFVWFPRLGLALGARW